jgi:hypothetical protein
VLGAPIETVTVLLDTAERLPAASAVYKTYSPRSRPDALRFVAVFAETETLFQRLPAAFSMLARDETATDDLIKYAVPASDDCTVAFPDPITVPEVKVAVGTVESTIIALEFAIDPDDPGEASVKTASNAAASLIAPPLSANADVEK